MLLTSVRISLADVIDGDWCRADGKRMKIRGPEIVTPGGNQTRGNFDHVTLARGAAVLAMATNTLAVHFRPRSKVLPPGAMGGDIRRTVGHTSKTRHRKRPSETAGRDGAFCLTGADVGHSQRF
jgi:hypothetical protein